MSLKADLNRLPNLFGSDALSVPQLWVRRDVLGRLRVPSRSLVDMVPGKAVKAGVAEVAGGEVEDEKVEAFDRLSGGVGGAFGCVY